MMAAEATLEPGVIADDAEIEPALHPSRSGGQRGRHGDHQSLDPLGILNAARMDERGEPHHHGGGSSSWGRVAGIRRSAPTGKGRCPTGTDKRTDHDNRRRSCDHLTIGASRNSDDERGIALRHHCAANGPADHRASSHRTADHRTSSDGTTGDGATSDDGDHGSVWCRLRSPRPAPGR